MNREISCSISFFHSSWFKADPGVLPHFKPLFKDLGVNNLNGHPKMRAQAKVFNDAMASFVENLDDVELLSILVQKMAKNHFNRGIKPKEFQVRK